MILKWWIGNTVAYKHRVGLLLNPFDSVVIVVAVITWRKEFFHLPQNHLLLPPT
jgi:hypothetical protein